MIKYNILGGGKVYYTLNWGKYSSTLQYVVWSMR